MTWVEVNDVFAPGKRGRTMAWEGHYPRYRLELPPRASNVPSDIPTVRFWVQWGADGVWAVGNTLPYSLFTDLLQTAGVLTRITKRKGPFVPDSVQEGDEYEMEPHEPAEAAWAPGTQDELRDRIQQALDEGIPLGGYRYEDRWCGAFDDGWVASRYRAAAERHQLYSLSPAERFWRRDLADTETDTGDQYWDVHLLASNLTDTILSVLVEARSLSGESDIDEWLEFMVPGR